MKPKLIVLNGPLGIGKSTLAKRYAEDHPLTLFLDIDDVWAMLSHWREKKDVSAPLAKQIAIQMAHVNLSAGHDVIIPQIIQTDELRASLQELANSHKAEFYEILLDVDKNEAIRRFILRGKADGYESGFRTGGIIDTEGREKKLSEMYDNMIEAASTKFDIIRIQPILDNIDDTYTEIVKALGKFKQ